MEINNNQQLSEIFKILDELTLLESTLDLNLMMTNSYKSTMTKQKEKLIIFKKTDLKLHSELENNLLSKENRVEFMKSQNIDKNTMENLIKKHNN